MNTKRPIVEFFGRHLPGYQFIGQKRPNLVFQHPQPGGIYRTFIVLRASQPHCLSVQVAATYDPHWEGEPARPLGVGTGLSNLRLRSDCIGVMQEFYFYDSTLAGLQRTLAEIHKEFIELALPFFSWAEQELLSCRLLQIALVESRRIAAEERAGLQAALDAVGGRVGRIEHPAFVRLRDTLRAAWSLDIPKEERRWASRLAYDALELPSA